MQLLTNVKARYLRRRDTIRQQVRQLSAEYDRKKATLEENETARGLEALEKKLRSYEQKIFDISECKRRAPPSHSHARAGARRQER